MKTDPNHIYARFSDDTLTALLVKDVWLEKVFRWCERTGTSFNKLETDATKKRGNSGLIKRVRENDAITLRVMIQIEDYMAANPDGPPA